MVRRDYRTAGKIADAQLSGLNWPLDLVWLGWALTGIPHRSFPSLISRMRFDGPPARKAVGVMPDPLPPEAPVARVTLSRAGIVSSRVLLLALFWRGEARGRGARAGGRPALSDTY